ncbi:MAG: DUF2490 domain-containing protein [Bacteroidia bacterium]|nr:DUF2490 domain-containing protein [Bacteroidia bacterium]
MGEKARMTARKETPLDRFPFTHSASACFGRSLCILLLLLVLLPFASNAQTSDLQGRAGVQVKQDFRKGFDLSLGYQARLDHGLQAFRGSYFTADLGYKLSKHLGATFEFRYATSPDWDKFRFGLALTGKTKVKKIDLSAKIRYQYEHFLQNWPEIGQFPDRQNIRLKLEAERKVIKHVRGHISIEPQIRIEARNTRFQRVRNIVGFDWEIVKNHHLDVSYYFQPQFKSAEVKYVNILAATFSLDLEKWKKKNKDSEKKAAD